MNVSVVDVGANQKKMLVRVPAAVVQGEIESRYRDLAKQVRIPGFRPGKAPRNILKSYYGKSIQAEVSSQIVQETYPKAVVEAALKPLAEADVSDMRFEDNGEFCYEAMVDICPPFEVEGYKGLKITRKTQTVEESRVDEEIERLRQQYAQLVTVEEPRPVKEGDIVTLDFTPWIDGTIFEAGKAQDFSAEVGKNTIHPEFDSHVVGHTVGETFSFELDYPQDAPRREIAGKRARFDVTLKNLKEKLLPEINDDFAQEAGQADSLEAFKQTIRDRLLKQEADKASLEVQQELVDQLLEKTSFELSEKTVDAEVQRMIYILTEQFQRQGIKIDASRFDTPAIRADYRPQAEKNVKRRLILEQISVQENLTLTDEETEEIFKEISRITRTDIDKVKTEFADSPFVEEARGTKIQDKVLKLLETEAVVTEASAE